MADQKLFAIHHVAFLVKHFVLNTPKKPAIFKNVSFLVHFDYFS